MFTTIPYTTLILTLRAGASGCWVEQNSRQHNENGDNRPSIDIIFVLLYLSWLFESLNYNKKSETKM